MKRIFALFLILCVLCAPAWAETRNVKTKDELWEAINLAKDGDVIKVEAGTYKITQAMFIHKSITIKGADKTTTVLDGGGGSNSIFYVADSGLTVNISGFTIQRSGCGLSVGSYTEEVDNITTTVEDCIFKDNNTDTLDKSSGITVEKGCTVTVKNCSFTGNSSDSSGGAIETHGTLTLEVCDFTNNTTNGSGGAVFSGKGGSLTARNCTFTNNKTNTNNDTNGGAIYTWQTTGDMLTLEGCSFTENICSNYGGALYLRNETALETMTLSDCDFTGNKAGEGGSNASGGAIYVHNGNMTARNCTFANNEIDGGGNGGAIYQDAGMTLINCTFTENNAGGGTSVTSEGGAIYVYAGQNKMVHCTLVNNLAQKGMELSVRSKTDMVNSVIYNKDSDDSKWAVCTGVENWQSPEAKLNLDSCAVANDVLNHKGVDNVDCKTISGWAPETVTFTRENGHEATVVQSAGIILGGGAALTGKVLSSVASTYGVDEEFIKADMTGRKRDASAPELGAVSSGKMSPTEPPVIVSFDVEGLKDGGTMIVGRTYTAKATATGDEITWSVLASDALTCTDPDPSVGNSTTFTVTPKPNTDGSAATIILTASNTKGSRKKSLTFSVQTAQEAASSDVTQLIDGETKEKMEKVIGNTFGAYPVMTMQEVSQYISRGGYVPEGIVPDSSAFAGAITLPAFTLQNLPSPVVLVLKVAGLTVSDRTLHFYKMHGAKVSGAAAARLAGVDTSEDKEAVFLDEDTIVTTVTASELYVAALYQNGSYAPVVTTSPATPTSSHGGGCDAGLCGLAVLLLAVPLFRRGKR